MEKILEIIFFLFPIFSINVNALICPASLCGTFLLVYPFKEQNSQSQNNCTYLNLTCNDAALGKLNVNLPYSGDFYVRYINYDASYVELYDPENCLARRLMNNNLNLSSSPFKAMFYVNYTFYTCPLNVDPIGYNYFHIDCLSNSTNVTMASTLVMLDVRLGYGCNVIGSWMIPVLSPDMFDIGGIGNFYLTWNSTSCKACEYEMYRFDGDGSKDNLWKKFAGSPFFVPSFVAMAIFFVIFLLQITKYIAGRNGMNSNSPAVDALPESTTAPPQSTAGGLDESKISSCTELVVLSGIRRNPGADCNICSICLESYSPREILRSIAKCEHYFHADCIELWLSKNSTCPLCRTVLADVEL